MLTIRGRLVVLLLALGLPFSVYLGVSSWRQADEERALSRQQLLGVARLAAARLDDHVGDIRQLLWVLAEVVEPRPDALARNDRLLRGLAGRLPPQINNLSIWCGDGMLAGSFDARLEDRPPRVGAEKFFVDAMAGAELALGGPRLARINGEPIATFAVPIRRDGVVVGVVAASSRLRPLQALITPAGLLPSGAVVTVLDEHGVVIARSLAPDRWIGRSLGMDAPAGRAPTGVRLDTDADGRERLSAFAVARHLPWRVDVGVPAAAAAAAAGQRLLEDLLVGGMLLGLGFAVASLVAHGIAEPLRRLGEDAGRLGRGDLAHRSTVRSHGEIGALARSINRMADSLAERTASLGASQEQLRRITDNLPAMISYVDPQRCLRFANRRYRDWLGVDPQDLLGRSLEQVYGSAAYARFRHHVDAALAGRRVQYERDLDTLEGVRRVEVTLVPHAAPEGKVLGLFVLIADVTEARAALAARQQVEERLTLALEASATAFFDWDIVADRLYHSPQAAVMRGEPAQEETAPVATLRAMIHPDDLALVGERGRAAIAGRAAEYDVEFRIRHRDHRWVWIKARGRVVARDAGGRARRMIGTYADITTRKDEEERLRLLAEFDPLTGLPNRTRFHDRLVQAMARGQEDGKRTAVLFLDIDHFKEVNDTFGHAAGDRVLVEFARVLRDTVRTSDTVARLAGDEFTVILEGLRDAADAEFIAANMVRQVARTVEAPGKQVTISTSIGITFVEPADRDPGTVLQRADAALYQAKQAGRNRFVTSAPGELAASGWGP